MKIKRSKFGVLSSGEKVYLYTIKNDSMSFSVTNFGCIITSIMVPSKNGEKQDVVLGCSDLHGYVACTSSPFFGAFIGRFANRIANAQFSLNGTTYQLDVNDGKNCLHGGFSGYDKKVFDSSIIENDDGVGVKFTRLSKNGEQGFPGNVHIEVSYILNQKNEIHLRYRAFTDRDTPINFTNHTYFNLTGNSRKTIFNHELMLNADSYLEATKDLMPTGKRINVADSAPFDFRNAKKIGKDFAQVPGGYDHNYIINADEKSDLTVCASAYEPESGRSLLVSTNQPGVQFYAGNSLGGAIGKCGQVHEPNQGFCLETQQFPDAPNQSTFPSCILHPGEEYDARTVWAFSW